MNPATLSLRQAIALMAMVWRYAPSKANSTAPNSVAMLCCAPFSPNEAYSEELISQLEDAGLISRSIQTFKTVTFPIYIFSNEVTCGFIAELEEIISTKNWPTLWINELFGFAIELAILECQEFFYFCANERMFPKMEEKLIEPMLRNLLIDFSIGQVFRIIECGAQYTSDFMVKHDSTFKFAEKHMVISCKKFATKARKEKLILQPLPRHAECTKSTISVVFYDLILSLKKGDIDAKIPFIHFPN